MKIVKFSHFFVVCGIDNNVERDIVRRHCIPLVHRESHKNPHGEIVYGDAVKYFYYNKVKGECHFHINTLDDFLHLANQYGVPKTIIKFEQRPLYQPAYASLPMHPDFTPKEKQVPVIDYFTRVEPHIKLCTLQTGQGKAELNSELVLTPQGWKQIGDMQIGDVVVCPDQSRANVVGVFPQGITEVYTVTLADGRKIECCPQHLWKVYYINTQPHCRWRVVDTIELQRLISMPNPRVYLPLIEPYVGHTNDELLLDPYLLGALIGDGVISTQTLGISNRDDEVIARCGLALQQMGCRLKKIEGDVLYRIYAIKDVANKPLKRFRETLEKLNLFGCRSWEKTIPEAYMDAPLEVRIALLQGLFDTDGTASLDGVVQYSTTSEVLAKQIQYLVWSMGDHCKISERRPFFKHKGERRAGRLAYILNVRSKKPTRYFSLTRKGDRVSDLNQYSNDLKIAVKRVEKTGLGETTCIAIDHPEHLYITTNFVVTHNTFSYLYAVSKWAMRSMMVVRPQYFDAWVIALLDPVKRVTLMEPDRILTIQGSPELKKAIAKAKAGEFDYDFVLMANRTLFNMNKVYEEKGSTKADYGCEPWELYELLEIGILGKDEGHMDFHANYRIDLFMHVPMSITLTATFDTDKAHNAKMQLQQHPLNTRAPDMGYIKYIRVIGYRYRLSSDYELRHKLRGRSEYNHNQLEESILKNKKARKNYLGLITEAITQYYLKRKTDSLQKLLILCGRVDMVEAVVQHIDEVWDDVTGARYVSGDSLPEVIKSDIIVTTIISGKAAIDIPNLITTVNTVNVGSKDTNEQALGRTRELKAYPGLDPMFIYFYTEDIPAAYNYHLNKRGIFIDKVLSMDTVDSGFTI